MAAPRAARPPCVADDAAWQALVDAVAAQPALPPVPWRVHTRLTSALAQASCAREGALVLAHDALVLPWRAADGAWHNLPQAPGRPAVVKRFLCAPSLAAWRAYEAKLPPAARIFYEVLRTRSPVRYWLDLDLTLTEALFERLGPETPARCCEALARALEPHAVRAIERLFDVEPGELLAVSVDGNGGTDVDWSAGATPRVSLHIVVTGARLPDNEHAAAAVRLEVLSRLRSAADGGEADAAAVLARCVDVSTAVDRINTRNRLRRLTGHTKLGQHRHSAPLPRFAHLPAEAFFVAGGTERVLTWRGGAPLRALSPPAMRERALPAASAASRAPAAVEDAIRLELRALSLGATVTVASLLPPSAKFPCWTAFTTCGTCPWRAQDSPTSGRAPGPAHRSSRVFVAFHRDRIELGCTAPRHAQRITLAYAQPAATPRALFPDAAADVAAQLETLSLARSAAPPHAPLDSRAEDKENWQQFMDAHLADVFTPSFCGGARTSSRTEAPDDAAPTLATAADLLQSGGCE